MEEFISEIINYMPFDMEEYTLTERQEEAVNKLSLIPEKGFIKMLSDVCNDLKRRQKEEYDKDNLASKKFSKLSDAKFLNLMVDILTVYKKKYKSEKNNCHKEKGEILTKNQKVFNLNKEILEEKNVCLYDKINYIVKTAGLAEDLENEVFNNLRIIQEEECFNFFENLKSPIMFANSAEKYLLKENCLDGLNRVSLLNEKLLKLHKNKDADKNEISRVLMDICNVLISENSYRKIYLVKAIIELLKNGISYLEQHEEFTDIQIVKNDVNNVVNEFIRLNYIESKKCEEVLKVFNIKETSTIPNKKDFKKLISLIKMLLLSLKPIEHY